MSQVLIIDADPSSAGAIEALLRSAGDEVTVRGSGHDGIAAGARSFDLIITELRLPDMSGLDAVRMLRSRVGTPIVIITAHACVRSAFEAARLGVTDYLEKPVPAQTLLELVRRLAASTEAGDYRVSRALVVIHRRYREASLSLESVAGEVGVSREHLCRLLRRHTRRTFLDHVHDLRVREAARLLRGTTLSVKEIADCAGFDRTGRLDKCFKRHLRTTPVEYRQAARTIASLRDPPA